MAVDKRRISGFATFVFLSQLLFDGMPLITRSSRAAVHGSVSTATCECASCGATICRSACKHDCSQCCRCCIYFEIRVGRRDLDSYLDFPFIGVGRDDERVDDLTSAAARLQSELLLRRRRRQIQFGDDEMVASTEHHPSSSELSATNSSLVGAMVESGRTVRRATFRKQRTDSSAQVQSSRSHPGTHEASQTNIHAGSTIFDKWTLPPTAAHQRLGPSAAKRLSTQELDNPDLFDSGVRSPVQPVVFSSTSVSLASPDQLRQSSENDVRRHLPCPVGSKATRSIGHQHSVGSTTGSEMCLGARSSARRLINRRRR